MDSELKQEFTRRISCCNRGGLIVVIYDIFFAYAEDAKKVCNEGNEEAFRHAVRRARAVTHELRGALDFKYPISSELYPLYRFADQQLGKSIYKNDIEGLLAAEKVLKNLYAGFVEAAKQDCSEPLMKHTQQVVAGMTYQKGYLTETLQDSDISRGFFV